MKQHFKMENTKKIKNQNVIDLNKYTQIKLTSQRDSQYLFTL